MAIEILIMGEVPEDALERLDRLFERLLEEQNPGRKFVVGPRDRNKPADSRWIEEALELEYGRKFVVSELSRGEAARP